MFLVRYSDGFQCEELKIINEDNYNLTFSVDSYVRFIAKRDINKVIKDSKTYYIVCDEARIGAMRLFDNIYMDAKAKIIYYTAVADKVREDYMKWGEL